MPGPAQVAQHQPNLGDFLRSASSGGT
jgi:hypothetical protein